MVKATEAVEGTAYHHVTPETNFINSSKNFIIRLLNKLETKTIIICIRRCKVSHLYMYHNKEISNQPLEESIINTSQLIDTYHIMAKVKSHQCGGAD